MEKPMPLFDYLFSFFYTPKDTAEKQDKPQKLEVKGYMWLSNPQHMQKLDINAYLNGQRNEEMKKKLTKFGLPENVNMKIFSSSEEAIKDRLSLGPSGFIDGGIYILRLGYDKETVYKMTRESKFHLAVIDAQNFNDVRSHIQNNNFEVRTISNTNFNMQSSTAPKLTS